MTVLKPALLPVKTAQFTQFFPSDMTSHSKTAQFNRECIVPYSRLKHLPFSEHVGSFMATNQDMTFNFRRRNAK
jgi:hypothetical protein